MDKVEISDMDVQKLLDEISGISEKYDLLHERTGEKFDIFKILDVYKDEKRVCRVLCELLSPKGSHCQGALYLKLFVRDVLNKHLRSPLPESEFESDAAVDREFRTEGNRSVDLMIQTSMHRRFIPIEVKITAKDQYRQCKDYFEEAKRLSAKRLSEGKGNVTLFYLTPWGKEPDDNSLGGLTVGKDVICVSFAEDILSWLADCLRQPETIRIAPVREVLQQFMKAIRGFTNQLEDDVKMEYVKVITGSLRNFKAAVAIGNTIKELKKEKCEDFLEKVKKKTSEMGIEEPSPYKKRGLDYEKIRLDYAYKGMSDKKIEVRVGIDDETYVSYYCENVGGLDKFQDAVNEKYSSSVDSRDVKYYHDDAWFYWERCHLEGQDYPDFLYPNDAFYELLDDEKMEEFANVCAEKIKRFLDFRMPQKEIKS